MKKKTIQDDFWSKIKNLKKDELFLATITLFNEKKVAGKELETFLFVNGMPYEEIPGIKQEINRLFDEIK